MVQALQVRRHASRQLLAEGLGTALLLAMVIGSGVMAQRLAAGNAAIALLANSLATVGGLYILIEVFGPVSGAHFNPAVSLVMAARGRLAWALLPGYVVVQLTGAVLGAWLAHAMFDMSRLQFSTKVRSGPGQWIAEAVATFGLLLIILRAPPGRVAAMVAAWIGAAYWFTASTSPSPIPPPRSGACSATPSPASRPRACPLSCWPSWPGPRSASWPTGRWAKRRRSTRSPQRSNTMRIRHATPGDAAALQAVYAPIVDATCSGTGKALYERLFDRRVAGGWCQAFAGIALPDAASIALHESLGFEPIGVHRNVGFKMAR